MIGTKPVIRVLIVDDSAFMRRAIAKMLDSEDDISVVGMAATGEEGVALQAELKPDLITMDVEMPGIGGLAAAKTIIGRRGPPIIMISSLTRDGAETTLRALEMGAVDFLPKPDSALTDILRLKSDLLEKVRLFGTRGNAIRLPAPRRFADASSAALPSPSVAARPAALRPILSAAAGQPGGLGPAVPGQPLQPSARPPAGRVGPFECVALGTSTGGPVALSTVLPKLPPNFPLPIVIVQHMPPGFTKPLADRLNAASRITVVEGQHGMRLQKGTAIIAPAGQQLTLRRCPGYTEVRLEPDTQKSLHVPSVDVMAAAAGDVFGKATLGVILTGMGHDGVAGLSVIKKLGGYVLGQDEASAVVYGMPRAAAAAGLVDRVVALDDVARVLCDLTNTPYIAA